MRRQAIAAIRTLLVLSAVLGVLYPLAVTGIAQVAMPWRANGSLLAGPDGAPVGSSLLGQPFEGDAWFRGRPGTYDPAASGPSNLGPSNPELDALIRERLTEIEAVDAPEGAIPVDAVTASASGLDPDISPAYARLQAPRVAAARGLALDDVLALVRRYTRGRTFGFLGEPRVNVLRLNLALESLASRS